MQPTTKPRGDPSRLTERQRRFVDLMMSDDPAIGHFATRAAKAAGYAWPSKQGPRLLTFPHVAEQLDAAFLAQHPEAAWLFK